MSKVTRFATDLSAYAVSNFGTVDSSIRIFNAATAGHVAMQAGKGL